MRQTIKFLILTVIILFVISCGPPSEKSPVKVFSLDLKVEGSDSTIVCSHETVMMTAKELKELGMEINNRFDPPRLAIDKDTTVRIKIDSGPPAGEVPGWRESLIGGIDTLHSCFDGNIPYRIVDSDNNNYDINWDLRNDRFGPSTLAIAYIPIHGGSKVIFNLRGHNWATYHKDIIKAVMAHEGGHAMGVLHDTMPGTRSIMAPTINVRAPKMVVEGFLCNELDLRYAIFYDGSVPPVPPPPTEPDIDPLCLECYTIGQQTHQVLSFQALYSDVRILMLSGGDHLDYWAGQFGVARQPREASFRYAQRIWTAHKSLKDYLNDTENLARQRELNIKK